MQPILLYLVVPIPACVLGATYLFFELSNFFNGSAGEGQGSHLGGVAFGGLFFAFKKLESSKNRYVAPNTHAGIGTTKYSNIGCIGAFNIAQVTTAATDPDAPIKSNYII